MSTAARDLTRERRLLTEASRGHQAFINQAQERLEAGEELFGSSWAWIGVRKHIVELLEEAADIGSWSVLADQALDLDPNVTDVHRQQTRAVLAIAARRGAQAHEALTTALRSLGAPS
jgi:hypothetical protein